MADIQHADLAFQGMVFASVYRLPGKKPWRKNRSVPEYQEA
jgi:hypothetical protein